MRTYVQLEYAALCVHVGVGVADATHAECVRALKEPALPRASYFSDIALSGSCRLRSTLAAASVLIAHAAVTAAKNVHPTPLCWCRLLTPDVPESLQLRTTLLTKVP